jgi:hypothetical protein
MAQKDDELRLATHRERAAKVEARIQHREKMKGDALYRKFSRARTSLGAAIEASQEIKLNIDFLDRLETAAEALDSYMLALRAPKPTEGAK